MKRISKFNFFKEDEIMVNISGTGTTDSFTGAYNKRIEQNKYRAAAEQYHAEKETRQTASEYLGATVSISEESKEFMAGIADRKAAQRAAKEAVSQEYSGNVFSGTGDFKQQYLVLSENLYNNGFYDNLSDDEVQSMEGLLRQITSGMDSINGSGLNINPENEMSHEAAKMELTSSVNALNYFADKYVPEEMRDSFKEVVKQYESYNSAKVAVHKNIYDMRDESMSKIAPPNAVSVSEMVRKTQEETKASQEIGKVKHTKEEEKSNKQDIQALFEQLMKKESDVTSVFDSLQKTLVDYASGGSKNSAVTAMLQSRNNSAFANMADYWTKLL